MIGSVCPTCGGEDQFYPSYAHDIFGVLKKTKGFHCLHCGHDVGVDGKLMVPPKPKSEWYFGGAA